MYGESNPAEKKPRKEVTKDAVARIGYVGDDDLLKGVKIKSTVTKREFTAALDSWWSHLDPSSGEVDMFSDIFSDERRRTRFADDLKRTIHEKHKSGSHAVDECLKLFKFEVLFALASGIKADGKLFKVLPFPGKKIRDLLSIASEHCNRIGKGSGEYHGSEELHTLSKDPNAVAEAISKAAEDRRSEAKKATTYMIREGLEKQTENVLGFIKARMHAPSGIDSAKLHELARVELGNAFVNVFKSMDDATKEKFVNDYVPNLLQAAMFFASQSGNPTLTPSRVMNEGVFDPYWSRIPTGDRLDFVYKAAEALRREGIRLTETGSTLRQPLNNVVESVFEDVYDQSEMEIQGYGVVLPDEEEPGDTNLVRRIKKLMHGTLPTDPIIRTTWQIEYPALEYLRKRSAEIEADDSALNKIKYLLYELCEGVAGKGGVIESEAYVTHDQVREYLSSFNSEWLTWGFKGWKQEGNELKCRNVEVEVKADELGWIEKELKQKADERLEKSLELDKKDVERIERDYELSMWGIKKPEEEENPEDREKRKDINRMWENEKEHRIRRAAAEKEKQEAERERNRYKKYDEDYVFTL